MAHALLLNAQRRLKQVSKRLYCDVCTGWNGWLTPVPAFLPFRAGKKMQFFCMLGGIQPKMINRTLHDS